MTRILGVDPSLTSTGLALIDLDDRLVIDTWTVASKPRGDSIAARLDRLDRIVDHIATLDDVAIAVIEAPAYDSRTGSQHDRSGLWWLTVAKLTGRDIPVVEVTTGGVKKYATGKGNASKDAVLLAVARRWAHVDVQSNDEADALVLASMGADALTGRPLVELPARHREALDAVTWPEVRA